MLKERFYNTYRLCGDNIEKFKLLLRKRVYPYEYMDSWDKFKLPVPLEKEYYYSKLNDSSINDGDIEHKKNVCNTFNINKLGKYHNLYVSSDTALLADVFENFRDKCLAIDKLDPAYYLSAPALSWHSGLKTTGQTLKLIKRCYYCLKMVYVEVYVMPPVNMQRLINIWKVIIVAKKIVI